MAELTFISADLENDEEICEEDPKFSLHVSADLNVPSKVNTCQPAGEKHEGDEEGVVYRQETVEICQKTVNPHNRVNAENFKIQRVIGKGGYGKVFLVQKVDGVDKNKLYAMKVLKKARLVCNEKDKAHTVSERNILEILRHPFLVRLHYAFQNHSNLYIVLEYCPGGELFNYLEREGALLENAACFYASEIVLAIGHLHSLGIIYRDLKSENVLLDRQGHVKLTDFGLSKEGVCMTNTFCGTIEYMAPEIIKCEGHGKPVDWWSLGTLIFDMLSGGPPFSQEESREATTHKILTAPIRFPPSFSLEVTSLIRGLLKRDPKERLGSKEDVEEIKRHKFFRRHDINWSDVYHRRLKPPFRPKLLAENDVSMFDPTFTQLQPVVSPADAARPIPPDMFQGFSYVAPSVCEDTLQDTWTNLISTHQRRQYGARGAMSTGRLRRIGAFESTLSTKIPEGIHLSNIPFSVLSDFRRPNGDPSVSKANESKSHEVFMGSQRIPKEKCFNPGCSQNDGLNTIKQGHFSSENAGRDKLLKMIINSEGDEPNEQIEPQADDDTVDDNDDEDDEMEEENVPGAKQIVIANLNNFKLCKADANICTTTMRSDVGKSLPHMPRCATDLNSLEKRVAYPHSKPGKAIMGITLTSKIDQARSKNHVMGNLTSPSFGQSNPPSSQRRWVTSPSPVNPTAPTGGGTTGNSKCSTM